MVECWQVSTMGLNIKNAEVEQLAGEVAGLAHETKTEAIRRALLERRARLRAHAGKLGERQSLREYLERNVWPPQPVLSLTESRYHPIHSTNAIVNEARIVVAAHAVEESLLEGVFGFSI